MKKREHLRSDALVFGAGKGSRTLLSSLGSLRSTDELHPQGAYYFSTFSFKKEGERRIENT